MQAHHLCAHHLCTQALNACYQASQNQSCRSWGCPACRSHLKVCFIICLDRRLHRIKAYKWTCPAFGHLRIAWGTPLYWHHGRCIQSPVHLAAGVMSPVAQMVLLQRSDCLTWA